PVGQCDGEMALTHARGSEEDDVLSAFDERETCQFGDLRSWNARGEAEVELLQRLDCRKRGQFHQGRALALGASVGFGNKQPLEEVGETAFCTSDVLRDGRPVGGDALELQGLRMRCNPLVLQLAHAAAPTSSAS